MQKRIESIFDKIAESSPSKVRDVEVIKKILSNFDIEGKSVLEVGCGFGDNLLYCKERKACYVEGFDISAESIKIAKSKLRDQKNVLFHRCSFEEYGTKKQFDIIIGWGIFEYFDNPLESLKKMRKLLSQKGKMLLLISRPIFIKKLSFLPRLFLSRIPLKAAMPVTKFISKTLNIFSSRLKTTLYTNASKTYSIEQAVLDGLMVPRYNVFSPKIFTDYLKKEGFSVRFFEGVAPSTVCIIAEK